MLNSCYPYKKGVNYFICSLKIIRWCYFNVIMNYQYLKLINLNQSYSIFKTIKILALPPTLTQWYVSINCHLFQLLSSISKAGQQNIHTGYGHIALRESNMVKIWKLELRRPLKIKKQKCKSSTLYCGRVAEQYGNILDSRG